MSDVPTVEPRLGFLLLRDGHAVPLAGVSPPSLKAGAKHLVPNPEAEQLRHRQVLTAIVDRLGFAGDFGTFTNRGWPDLQAFLKRHQCTHRAGLFPSDHGGCLDLFFGPLNGPTRRQLADRIFESDGDLPTRVFLGYGIDWAAWNRLAGPQAAAAAAATLGTAGDLTPKVQELFDRRVDLLKEWGFLDDKLVGVAVRSLVNRAYFLRDASDEERRDSRRRCEQAVRAFRSVFDTTPRGWVDVLLYNDRLVILRAEDGAWDMVWRAYREHQPPTPGSLSGWTRLAMEDTPGSLMRESDRERAVHMRQEVWEEFEAHHAEQAFYDRGGTPAERQLVSSSAVRVDWLREQGRFAPTERLRWEGSLPEGFREVVANGARLAVSELVTLASYRRMLQETGYLGRRAPGSESWQRSNKGAPDEHPVGASWSDAQAYCAWLERQLRVAVRLPSKAELRGLRPFHSKHYEQLSYQDFPWEGWPPRPLPGTDQSTPSAVRWSEPRFMEPGPETPEFPVASGWGSKSRKSWIEDFPPSAVWCSPLPLAHYEGLGFIDAWDAYEWCQETGQVSGRFWEGPLGPTSWGAYKNSKVTFRVVLELGE